MPTIIRNNYKNLVNKNLDNILSDYKIKGFVISNIGNLDLLDEYLDYYVDLINLNKFRCYEKFKTQKHHIIPKCLGGLPKTNTWTQHENIIWLTAKEHFIAHKLLAQEFPENRAIVSA